MIDVSIRMVFAWSLSCFLADGKRLGELGLHIGLLRVQGLRLILLDMQFRGQNEVKYGFVIDSILRDFVMSLKDLKGKADEKK